MATSKTIAILGAGNVGGELGRLFSHLGYKIIFSTRDPSSAKMQQLLSEAPNSVACSVEEAVKHAEVNLAVYTLHFEIVLLSTPWSATEETIKAAGDLSGKILIDATNPIAPGWTLAVGTTSSGGEQVAHWAKGSPFVVKAFNTIGSKTFATPIFDGHKVSSCLTW
jgi:predicted dinucleotide-binding enzyme